MFSLATACRFLIVTLSLTIVGCQTQWFDPDLAYGLTGSDLEKIGQAIGFDVTPMGMGEFVFQRGRREFSVHVHNGPATKRQPKMVATTPVWMACYNGDVMKPLHQRSFDVARGMPMDDIIREFRLFVADLESKPLRGRKGR